MEQERMKKPYYQRLHRKLSKPGKHMNADTEYIATGRKTFLIWGRDIQGALVKIVLRTHQERQIGVARLAKEIAETVRYVSWVMPR